MGISVRRNDNQEEELKQKQDRPVFLYIVSLNAFLWFLAFHSRHSTHDGNIPNILPQEDKDILRSQTGATGEAAEKTREMRQINSYSLSQSSSSSLSSEKNDVYEQRRLSSSSVFSDDREPIDPVALNAHWFPPIEEHDETFHVPMEELYHEDYSFLYDYQHAYDLQPLYITPKEDLAAYRRERGIPEEMSTIFFITPTYIRPTQLVDMARLSQTLMLDAALYWIVVEDHSGGCTKRIRDLLLRTGIPFAHINKRSSGNDINTIGHRGVEQRNVALKILDNHHLIGDTPSSGIIFFGDDDNAYDVRLFNTIRELPSNRVGILGVAFRGDGRYQSCLSENDYQLSGFATNWPHKRRYPIDMAQMAIPTQMFSRAKNILWGGNVPQFSLESKSGYLESDFLDQILDPSLSGQEIFNDWLYPLSCQEIFVYHVRTAGYNRHPVVLDPYYHAISSLV